MNQPDLNDYTIEELEEMNAELMRQRAELIVKQRALAHVLEGKRSALALQADIAAVQRRHGITLAAVD